MSELEFLRWSSAAPGERAPGASPLRRAVATLVLDTVTEGIWLIDAQARTTFVNRRLADLLGYTEDEMIGRPVFAFLDPARWPIAERNLQERRLGVEDRQEVELIRKDCTRVWVLASANPVFGRNGEYAGALAVVGDLTALKAREHRLQGQVDVLSARVAATPARPDRRQADESPYREPFRTAIVLGVYGTFVATVALLTVGGVVGSLFGLSHGAPQGDE